MSSEAREFTEVSSLIERLINSRNRDVAMFLPFILALTERNNSSSNPDQETSNPDGEEEQDSRRRRSRSRVSSRDRIILINPLTQGMIVIEGGDGDDDDGDGTSSFDLLMRDLLNKEGQPPASKASIDAMSVVEIESKGEEECVICLEEFEVGGMAKQMPCKHKFHGDCIEKWLNIHGSCPVCRHKMPVDSNFEKSKNSDENGSGRRREIWVSFSLANHSSSSSNDSSPILDQNTDS